MQGIIIFKQNRPFFQSNRNFNYITSKSSSIQGFFLWSKQCQSDAARSELYVWSGRSSNFSYLIASTVDAQCELTLSWSIRTSLVSKLLGFLRIATNFREWSTDRCSTTVAFESACAIYKR
jgi:hypothetical protein